MVDWQAGGKNRRPCSGPRVLCPGAEPYYEDGGFYDEQMMIMIVFVIVMMMVVSSMIGLPPLAVLVGSQRNRSLEGLNLENNPQIFFIFPLEEQNYEQIAPLYSSSHHHLPLWSGS